MYDFSNLKREVKKLFGIDPDQVKSSFKTKKIKRSLTTNELKNKITFEYNKEHGVFFGEDGIVYKGFLYIPTFNPDYAARRGWNTLPKFHVTKCDTILSQIKKDNFHGHYVFVNHPVEIKDIDGEYKDIELCGNCCRETNFPKMNTEAYCKGHINNKDTPGNFQAQDIPKEYDTNFWGYTPDWYEKSKKYRQSQNFTCESCGIKLDGSNGYYLDTHHISGNKTNNNFKNLKCLCLLCHANVDERHKQNFSTGRNHKRLLDFLEVFKNELSRLENPYL